jgi:hypothetical protein
MTKSKIIPKRPYDSSFYRVTPLMNNIKNDLNKINAVLSLCNIRIDCLPTEYKYGNEEKLLKPQKQFLLDLVDYIRTKDGTKMNYKKSRYQLYLGTPEERDAETINAKKLIDEQYDNLKPNSKKWYIFEDFTHPDIFIEGTDYVIIVEGKWTEDKITTHTENLANKNGEYRCQMIRHIQAAINSTNKKVHAFYIVDANSKYLNELTKSAFLEQMKKETIKVNEINQKVYDSFYGYTTWQKIKEVIPEVQFFTKEEIDIKRKLIK